MTKEDKRLEDRFYFRKKKRKPEVLLEDAFRIMKASILLKQVESNIPHSDRWRIRCFERHKPHKFRRIEGETLANMFMTTKPYTGLTREASLKLVFNLWEIRRFRKERQKRVEKISGFFFPESGGEKKNIWQTDQTSRGRLFPLSMEKYQAVAEKIWKRNGYPKFHKSKIDGIKMGMPVTRRDNRYGFYNHILERRIGVMQELVNSSQFGLICHIYN